MSSVRVLPPGAAVVMALVMAPVGAVLVASLPVSRLAALGLWPVVSSALVVAALALATWRR